jgi:RHS repeat-associated protein
LVSFGAENSYSTPAPGTEEWKTLDINDVALASSTNYNLGVWVNSTTGGNGCRYRYDTNASYSLKSDTYTYSATSSPVSTAVIDSTLTSRRMSIYGTYTASSSNSAPTAPTSLLTEGLTNPVGVTDSTPEFSAIFNDVNASDTAVSYQVQVSTSTAFIINTWDSSKATLSSSTAQGARTPDISYTGTTLASSTQYYWRIRLWDNSNATGTWSTATSSFILASSPTSSSTSPTYPFFAAIPQHLTYTYDSVGNITQIIDRSGTRGAATTTYTYDNLYRLTSASTTLASSTPYRETYAYNAIGNITSKSDIGSYSYTGNTGSNYANPHAATTINGVTYNYDHNGNLASTSASQTNTWDYRNRLITATKSGTSTTYAYDVNEQRVQKTVGGKVTRYPSQYFETTGASTTKHVYANGTLVSSVDGTGSTTAQVFHNHQDHLGSTAAVTNNIGYLNNLYSYYPYGGLRLDEGGVTGSSTSVVSSPLYIDAIDGAWSNSSWSTTQTNSTTTFYSGTAARKVDYATPWGGFAYTRSLNTTPYSSLEFYVNIGTSTPDLYIYFLNQSGAVIQIRSVASYISGGFQTNTWHRVLIPLTDLGIANYNNTLTFSIESSLAQTVYYDQIQFLGTSTQTTQNTFTQPNQFIGQDRDKEADLSYLNARYYSSNQGLFTSQDLVFWEMGQSRDGLVALYKPQLQNSYSYAANSPIVNKDPDGRFLDTIADIGFIAYDIYSIGSAYANGQDVSEQISYLGLDVAGAFTPFATGFGAVARTAKVTNKADEAYAVYNLMDKNKNVRYTGITKQNPDTRFKQHLKDPNKAQVVDKIDVVANQPSKTQARLLEQASIEARGGTKGSELLNKRNSISPNSKLYSSAKSSLGSASDAVKRGDYASAIKQLQNVSNDLKKLK